MVAGLSFLSVIFASSGFAWAVSAIGQSGAGPYIIHFNDMAGITSVGDLGVILGMGIFGVVVSIMNFFISLALDERDGFLGKVVAGSTLIFAVLLFIAFASILNVN